MGASVDALAVLRGWLRSWVASRVCGKRTCRQLNYFSAAVVSVFRASARNPSERVALAPAAVRHRPADEREVLGLCRRSVSSELVGAWAGEC